MEAKAQYDELLRVARHAAQQAQGRCTLALMPRAVPYLHFNARPLKHAYGQRSSCNLAGQSVSACSIAYEE